jgi:hypothetical protein
MIENDRAGGTMELGPRSMALLRRILLALETIAGHEVPDLGRQYEDDEALVGNYEPTPRITGSTTR